MFNVPIKVLTASAVLPEYCDDNISPATCVHADLGSVGATLSVPDGTFASVKTGFAMAIPGGWFGLVAPLVGVTDPGIYNFVHALDGNHHGEVEIPVNNTTGSDITITHGDVIARIAFVTFDPANFVVVTDLPQTIDRENCGFPAGFNS